MESERNIKGLLRAAFIGDIKGLKFMIKNQGLDVNLHDTNG